MKFTISESEAKKRKEFFLQQCRKNSLRLTPQKEKIYEILSKTQDHPSAQEIFEEVQKIFSNISFATVYKNLKLFTDKKIIQELNFGENFSRYDALLKNHHHVFESKTKKTSDIPPVNIPIPKELEGKNIKKVDVIYTI